MRIDAFAKVLGVHVATIYRLPTRLRPKSVKLGGVRLVVEPVAAYLERIEAMQRPRHAPEYGWTGWQWPPVNSTPGRRARPSSGRSR